MVFLEGILARENHRFSSEPVETRSIEEVAGETLRVS
jgi:hypothetical protein